MNRNAKKRLEAAKQSKAQAARDAAYQAQCEREGLTPQQRRDRAMAILANVTATLSLAGVRQVY